MSSTEPGRGHRALPHTADVILEAWGPDFPQCCEEAVGALVGTFLHSADYEITRRLKVSIEADSEEVLLLDLLGEVIFVLDTAGDVPVAATVKATDSGGLDVELDLCSPRAVEPTGAAPKAISRSELAVERRRDAVTCRFLVDL